MMVTRIFIRPKHWLVVEDDISTSLISRDGGDMILFLLCW